MEVPKGNSMMPPLFNLEAGSNMPQKGAEDDPKENVEKKSKYPEPWEFQLGTEFARYYYGPNNPYAPNVPWSSKFAFSASQKRSDYLENSIKLSYLRGDYYPGSLQDPKADHGADVHKARLDLTQLHYDKHKHFVGLNANLSASNKLEKTYGAYPTQYGPSPYLGWGLGLQGGANLGKVGKDGKFYATGSMTYNKDYSLKSSKNIETYAAQIGAMYKDPRFKAYVNFGRQNRPGLNDNNFVQGGVSVNISSLFKGK